MKSFGSFISKHLVSFAALFLLLLFLDGAVVGLLCLHTFHRDSGASSPHRLLEDAAAVSDLSGTSEEMTQTLRSNHIWAMYLDQNGDAAWTLDLPEGVSEHYSIQEIAVFSKGYLSSYPVFVQAAQDGLLVLGYPEGSYTKLTSNYYSRKVIRQLPFYVAGILALNLLFMFLIYHLLTQRILRGTKPIISAIEGLSNGKPTSLAVSGELSEVAESVNRASRILSRQNEARANWISGVSHDIRTPLSMIMGYAERITQDGGATPAIRDQAEIIRRQSIKIKGLVQDLNLVSLLEYEMQPLHKEPVRLSKLMRAYAADLLNNGLPQTYPLDIDITPSAEPAVLSCDARLIARAIGNLVQNSIQHNPQGCGIRLSLDCEDKMLRLSLSDDGAGLSEEKLKELRDRPHYMESTDDRLDLRHGLGLLLVRQIAAAHGGTIEIESAPQKGCRVTLVLPAE